jgi:hypothetical protein
MDEPAPDYFMVYDPPADANVPYPGGDYITSYTGTREWRISGATGQETVFQVGSNTATVGDPIVGNYTLSVKGKLACEGSGTGTNLTGGFMAGYAEIQAYSGGASDVIRVKDGAITRIGGLSQDGTNFCLNWWVPGTAEDFNICRSTGNTLGLSETIYWDGGDMVSVSPNIFAGTRGMLAFGGNSVSAAEWNSPGTPLSYAGWAAEELPSDMGAPMIRAGSVTGVSVVCKWAGAPGTNGTAGAAIYKNGVTTGFSAVSPTISTAGPVAWSSTQARGTDTFVADDLLYVQVTEITANFNDASDCVAVMEVVFDD